MALAAEDRHGYAIIQDVRDRTDGDVELTASTLYAAVSRMLDSGLVVEVDDPQPKPANDDRRRRYYRITELGRSVARAEALRLRRTLEQAEAMGLGAGRVHPGPERAG